MGRMILISAFIAGALTGCGDADTEPSDSVVGSYVAIVFRVTPTGQPLIDVLAAGGSLTITISSNNTTTGNLNLPSSVTGGAPFVASMVGTVSVTSSTVEFQQSVDSFVRDLTWERAGSTLLVTNQAAGSAAYTITLSRQ